jgi:hypothetical protein
MRMIFMGCCLLARMDMNDHRRAMAERTCQNAATAIRNLLQRVQASGIQNAVLTRHCMLTGRTKRLVPRDMEILMYGAYSTAAGVEMMRKQSDTQQTLRKDHTFLGESQIVHFDDLDAVKLEGALVPLGDNGIRAAELLEVSVGGKQALFVGPQMGAVGTQALLQATCVNRPTKNIPREEIEATRETLIRHGLELKKVTGHSGFFPTDWPDDAPALRIPGGQRDQAVEERPTSLKRTRPLFLAPDCQSILTSGGIFHAGRSVEVASGEIRGIYQIPLVPAEVVESPADTQGYFCELARAIDPSGHLFDQLFSRLPELARFYPWKKVTAPGTTKLDTSTVEESDRPPLREERQQQVQAAIRNDGYEHLEKAKRLEAAARRLEHDIHRRGEEIRRREEEIRRREEETRRQQEELHRQQEQQYRQQEELLELRASYEKELQVSESLRAEPAAGHSGEPPVSGFSRNKRSRQKI